jgi:hypothetical protein
MQTGWRHKDPVVQKEFERLYSKQFKQAVVPTAPAKVSKSYSQNLILPERLSGILYIETLPFTPTELNARYPDGVPDEKFYEMRNYTHVPLNNHYGFMVYSVINHNFGLSDPNNYFLDQVYLGGHRDLSDYTNGDFDADAHFETRIFDDRETIFRHVGLDENNIYVYAVFKPDIDKHPNQESGFYGSDGYHAYLDESEHIIVTDLVYYYNLLKNE